MKYRHKLAVLLVATSFIPMILLAVYGHYQMRHLVRENEMDGMNSMLTQARESLDGELEVYTGLLNYLTYSPEIIDIITNPIEDSYEAYEKYTEVIDPLLTVPKSYHEAILQIQLFANTIEIKHGYTLLPYNEINKQWWVEELKEEQRIQWLINSKRREIAAVRKIYDNQKVIASLCITLDYDKVFQPFRNITEGEICGIILDDNGNIVWAQMPEERQEEIISVVPGMINRIQKEYAYVKTENNETGWNFFLLIPQRIISESVSQVLVGEVILIIICMCLILIFGMYFSRVFTRRIEKLTQNMNQVNHGVRVVTVESDSEDEVGLLVRSFRSMMEEIDRLISEVYENKIALKEFELKALTAQINPHFLYNSLSIINWMAIRSKQMQISKVTLALSTFYRTALSKGAEIVSIDTTITNIEAYLQIQLIMHDNNFTVEWDIEDEVRNAKIPKLLLQPIVENALEHGLDLKEDGERILKISMIKDKEDVLVIVEDNGIGMEQKKADELITYHAKGYGLKNVNDRICLFYGDAYKIQVISSVGEGTKVKMRIPMKGEKIDEIK